MKIYIKDQFLKEKRLIDTFYPSSFWLKTLKIPSTWNRKICSPAATLVRHLLALSSAAVFSFLSLEQKWGEEPTCPQHACQQRGRWWQQMGSQPVSQPCWADGEEAAVVMEAAEHESHGREEKELKSAGRDFAGVWSPLAAVAGAADGIQTNLTHVVLSAPAG